MNYTIRSSLYLLLLILDNIVSSDKVSVSSEKDSIYSYSVCKLSLIIVFLNIQILYRYAV